MAGNIPKPGLIQMRQVDHDAQIVASFDQTQSMIRQSRADVGRTGKAEGYAVAKDGRTAPDRSDGSQPRLIQHLKRVHIGVNRFGPFDMKDRGDLSRANGLSKLGCRSANGQGT